MDPEVFLILLHKNGVYVSPLPVSGNFTKLPELLKYDGQWLSHFIHQLTQNPWMYLMWSHGLGVNTSHFLYFSTKEKIR